MPVIYQHETDSSVSVCVWHITETEESLLQGLVLDEADAQHIASQKLPKRRLEKLACRQALAHLLQTEKVSIQYTPSGQPRLESGHISFSHSDHYAAVAYSPTLRVGIDIETIGSRILALHKYFLTAEETDLHDISNSLTLHQLWGAKEALYKLSGDEKLDFHNDILIKDKEIRCGRIGGKQPLDAHLEHFTIEKQLIVLAVEETESVG
ncbi:MAG: 4'-phosphopantetheinyl transferase superfamily protein [Bacteroidales bacterium]|nr:4'-phosphopantetheinyl transferase superfamily protein [Bacteroidales bacterium]